jgi:hypothetical protein
MSRYTYLIVAEFDDHERWEYEVEAIDRVDALAKFMRRREIAELLLGKSYNGVGGLFSVVGD